MKLEFVFPLAVFVFVILWGAGLWNHIPVREMIALVMQVAIAVGNAIGSIIH